MRFSKVGIVGTLMAAAVALLVILPVLAIDGKVEVAVDSNDLFSIAVFANITEIEDGTIGSATDTVDTDDVLFIDALDSTAPRDTRVGGDLYVSNDSDAFDTVLVTFKDDDNSSGEAGNATVEVKIESSNKEKLTLTLLLGTGVTDEWQGVFTVVSENATGNQLQADDGNTIDVKSPDGTILKLIVDGEGPEITGLSPEHEEIGDDDEVTYAATITDEGSGLRPDSDDEFEPGTGTDGDGDGLEAEEPISTTGGATIDIQINLDHTTKTATNGADESRLASFDWDDAPADGYSFEFTKADHTDGDHFWSITATDRAGNTTTTNVDEDDATDSNFLFTVDATKPEIRTAQTGITFDEAEGEEDEDDRAIKLVFVNEGTNDPDILNTDTIDASDFVVEDNEVVDIIHPNEEIDEGHEDLAGEVFDTRNVVYLILKNKLDPDEEPEVQMLGGALEDEAGNDNDNQTEDAVDTIAPDLDLTVTALDEDNDPNGVGGRPITDDNFRVHVVEDEDLNTAPKVFFITIEIDEPGKQDKPIVLAVKAGGSLDQPDKSKNEWEEDFDETDLPGSGSRLVAIIVTGEDDSDQHNHGATDGYKAKLEPARLDGGLTSGDFAGQNPLTVTAGDKLDLEKLDDKNFLMELDEDIGLKGNVDGVLLPNTGEDDETESRNPFITLLFDEAKEFEICDATGSPDQVCFDKIEDDEKVDVDSHETVTITFLELDGVDILDRLERVDDEEFSISLIGIDEGDYELLYKAVDEVGNELDDGEFKFEVLGRSEFELALRPGWNLISVPGTPAEPGLDDVLPDSLRVSRILQWVDGAFEVNERQSDGTWDPSGGVTEIVAGPGYWVFTTAFEDVETLIPERNPATILPTVDVVGGWNLIGVVDLTEPPEDEGHIVNNANDYLISLDEEFSIVYGFSTQGNAWTKLVNGRTCDSTTDSDDEDECLQIGKGYWVWANQSGTIVP